MKTKEQFVCVSTFCRPKPYWDLGKREEYKEAVNKESFIDGLAKYFNENAELIICGLATMNGPNPYPDLKSLSKQGQSA